jgi:hypothetical protein
MSALRWMPINPISITKSTNTDILQANTRKSLRRKADRKSLFAIWAEEALPSTIH